MKKLIFENVSALAGYMMDKIADEEYIAAVLFEEDTVALIKELSQYDEIDFGYLEFSRFEYDGYDDEYLITLTPDGVLGVERAKDENGYLDFCTDLVLIHGEASHAVIKDIPEYNCREIYIGFADEYEDDCGDCCGDCCNCKKIVGDEVEELIRLLFRK